MVAKRIHTFKKTERLKNRKAFELLFANGKSISASPVRLLWMEEKMKSAENLRAGFVVPKKNFKKAVHRNRIRRQMKEVYRLENFSLHENVKSTQKSYALLFTYTGKEPPVYKDLKEKIIILLHRFMKAAVSHGKTNVHSAH